MKLIRLSTVVLTLLAFVLTTQNAQASEARGHSLLYNLAIKNDIDAFAFPQLLADLEGMHFYLPGDPTHAYGGIVMNSGEHNFGLFVHRPMVSPFDQFRISALGAGTVALFGLPSDRVDPKFSGHIIDLMYSSNKDFGVGARFYAFSENGGAEGIANSPATANSMFAGELYGGMNFNNFELAGGVTFQNVKDIGTSILINAKGRSWGERSGKFQTVLAFDMSFGAFMPDEGDTDMLFSLPVKYGVNYQPLKSLTIGVLLGVDFQMIKPGGGDTEAGLAVPTVEMAAEWQIKKWLSLRTAARSGYAFQIASAADSTQPAEHLIFSSGLGIDYGPFRFDGVVEYGLWQNGPDFISGNAPGLFSGISMSYLWDRPMPKSLRRVVAAAKPAPEPAPIVAPAPTAPVAPATPAAPTTTPDTETPAY